VQVREALLARQHAPGVAEPIDRIDADDERRMLGQGERHPAAPAAGVEDPATDPDAGPVEHRQHLRAAVVLEQGVIVLGTKSPVGVGLDQVFADFTQRAESIMAVSLASQPRLVRTRRIPCPSPAIPAMMSGAS
jgi:hypothetical protein